MTSLLRAGSACALLVLLVLLAAGCDAVPPPTGSLHPAQVITPVQATQPSQAAAAAAGKQVVIDQFAFEPRVLVVAPGTRVTWINRDDVPHTATSNQKPRLFDSGALDTDGQFSHVFATPGTFDSFCAVHPRMTGQVIDK
jgi:plastocyanin